MTEKDPLAAEIEWIASRYAMRCMWFGVRETLKGIRHWEASCHVLTPYERWCGEEEMLPLKRDFEGLEAEWSRDPEYRAWRANPLTEENVHWLAELEGEDGTLDLD